VIASREDFATGRLARSPEEVLDESWVPTAAAAVDQSADVVVGSG